MNLSKSSNTIAAFTFCFVTAASQIFALYKEISNQIMKCHSKILVLPLKTYLYMEKWCSCDIGHWWTNLLSGMDHIYPKRIHSIPPNVIPVNPRNQHLPLVIIHKQSPDHPAPTLLLQQRFKPFNQTKISIKKCFLITLYVDLITYSVDFKFGAFFPAVYASCGLVGTVIGFFDRWWQKRQSIGSGWQHYWVWLKARMLGRYFTNRNREILH